MKTPEIATLEKAISEYMDTNDLSILQKFVGKCQGAKPYGEEELGKLINKGDLASAQKMIEDLTNFAAMPPKDDDETFTKSMVSMISKIEKAKKGQGGNNFMKIVKYILENLRQRKKPIMPNKLKGIITEQEWMKLVRNCF